MSLLVLLRQAIAQVQATTAGWSDEWVKLISLGIGPLIGTLIGAYVTYRSIKARMDEAELRAAERRMVERAARDRLDAEQKLLAAATLKKVEEVEKNTNSLTQRLESAVFEKGRAQGEMVGSLAERAKSASPVAPPSPDVAIELAAAKARDILAVAAALAVESQAVTAPVAPAPAPPKKPSGGLAGSATQAAESLDALADSASTHADDIRRKEKTP